VKGVVQWYNVNRGFGFIIGEDGLSYFVHYSMLNDGTKLLENSSVEFKPTKTDKGLHAHKVKKI